MQISLEPDTSINDLVTFTIIVKRANPLPGPLTAQIYGAKLDGLSGDLKRNGNHALLTWSGDVTGYRKFTVRRDSEEKELRVIPQYANLPVNVLVIPKKPRVLKKSGFPLHIDHMGTFTVVGDVPIDVGRAGRIMKSNRGFNPPDGHKTSAPKDLLDFTETLCLCASGRYDMNDGSCQAAAPSNTTDQLDLNTVKAPIPAQSCGGENEDPPLRISWSPLQVCYSQTLKIRPTPTVTRTCEYKWSITGDVLQEREVFAD